MGRVDRQERRWQLRKALKNGLLLNIPHLLWKWDDFVNKDLQSVVWAVVEEVCVTWFVYLEREEKSAKDLKSYHLHLLTLFHDT